jgi:hypothetical protein
VFEFGHAFLNVALSAEVKLNVYVVPVFEIDLYDTSSLEPVREMHASRDETAVPAGFEYVIVGFCSSLKFWTAVMFACLGMFDRATVKP